MNIHLIIQYVWAFFLAIGPILGYIPQYIDIKRTRHYLGFSSIICFILLTSNILRILSFFVNRYDVFLLAQSIFMVIVQFLMLHLIVKLSSRGILPEQNSVPSSIFQTRQNQEHDNRNYLSSFWAWKSFFDYFVFLTIFTILSTSIVLVDKFIFPSDFIKVGFLYVSTLIESTLCMPQAWTNWKNQSTLGLNNSLVISWISGDLFKLSYFIYSKSEMAFIVCAIIQIFVDSIIVLQIVYYRWFCIKKNDEMTERDSNNVIIADISRSSSVIPLKQASPIELK